MTEKRFWCLEEYAGETSPIVDEKFTPTNGWICDRLNELYEENKELKEERKGIESCFHNWRILYDEAKNKVEELNKENQELKYKYNEQSNDKIGLEESIEELLKENKELKRELKKCKHNKLFSRRELERENKELKEQLKNCSDKAKEEIRKQREENAIRWANIGR